MAGNAGKAGEGGSGAAHSQVKRHAPATERNREPIARVLAADLPESGCVLEVASGTGEHAVFLAERFPNLEWQPSDPDAEARASIAAYRDEAKLENLREPIFLDACAGTWPIDDVGAILCINMVHISPPEAAQGLFAAAGRLLKPGAPLILYGPFFEDGIEAAPSNLAFDKSLRSRDPRWGLRETSWLDSLADRTGLKRTRRVAMAANNLILVYRRT